LRSRPRHLRLGHERARVRRAADITYLVASQVRPSGVRRVPGIVRRRASLFALMSADGLGLAAVWLHLLGVAVWIGGLAYQAHVLLPAARRARRRMSTSSLPPAEAVAEGHPGIVADILRRGRWVMWSAVCLVVLTGLYNVTQLGPLERVMESGAGILLAAKFFIVLVMIALAAHRDFARLPAVARLPAPARDGAADAFRAIARLDRIVLILAAAVIYLGLAVSRLAH
jgi:uncharacterized membrane protein